jgi:hypothetical protein
MTLQPVDSGLLAGPHLNCRPDCMFDGGLTQTGGAPDGGSAGVPDGASDGGCSAVRCAHKTRAERELNELRNIGAAKGWERPFSSVTEGLTDGCQLAGQKGSTCAQCARGGRASNRTLHLHVVTPGNWPTGLPEQKNVSDFILSRVILDW